MGMQRAAVWRQGRMRRNVNPPLINPLLGGGGKGLCRLKQEAGFITSAKILLTINSGENPGYRDPPESQKEGKAWGPTQLSSKGHGYGSTQSWAELRK